jgi:soluble lytic murein transglycosylase
MSVARSTVRRRPSAAFRRARVRLRRRRLVVVGVVVACAGALALAWPTLDRDYQKLLLPLADAPIIVQEAHEKHLDPALIAGVIFAETKFDARTSATGALGLMQIEPATAAYLAQRSGGSGFTVADLGSPQVNIAYGAYYLRMLLDHFDGQELAALAAYNGGETNADHWVARAESAGHVLQVKDIPFPETRDYVTRVMNAQRAYRSFYAGQLDLG